MTTHEFPYCSQIVGFTDPHYNDRKIATDAVCPQTRLRFRVERKHVRARAQRRIGINDARGESLKHMRLFRVDLQVAHLNLGLGPGETRLTFEHVRIVILVGERHRFFTRSRNGGAKRTPDSLI